VTAPDTKALSKFYGTFDAAQMQQIKIDLAAVGVDLDAPKLPAMLEKPWWLPGNVTTPRQGVILLLSGANGERVVALTAPSPTAVSG